METMDRLAEDLVRVRMFLEEKKADAGMMAAYDEIRNAITEMIGTMMIGQAETTAEYEGDSRSTWWYVCGECHTGLDYSDKYCRQCGRRILWK